MATSVTSISVRPNTSIIGDCDRLAEALVEKQSVDIEDSHECMEQSSRSANSVLPLFPGINQG
jgi:hypothetical protein